MLAETSWATTFLVPRNQTSVNLAERINHNPSSWVSTRLEQFYPTVENEHLSHMETLVADVLEFAENNCGIVADITGSSPRRIGQNNTLMDQTHTEFKAATADLSSEDDWSIDKLKKGPDIDLKVRKSDHIPLNLQFGETIPQNLEFILFGIALEKATQTVSGNTDNIYRTSNGDTEVIAWPVDDKTFMKIKAGLVPDGANRRYCAVELHNGFFSAEEIKEPSGETLAELHMGYEPSNSTENKADRRAGGTVSDYMKMRIRLRGKDGHLLSHKEDIADANERLKEPDNGNHPVAFEKGSVAEYVERALRELRAESPFPSVQASTLEEMLLLAARPPLWILRREIFEHAARDNFQTLMRECGNNKIASLLTAEEMIIGDIDPWFLITSMANSGLIELNPYFRGKINSATYHDWLISDPLTQRYVSDHENGDKRNHRDMPLYQRNVEHIMSERQTYLEARYKAASEGRPLPSSGLMMLDRVFEHRPGESFERLNEDIFLKFMMYYFNFQSTAVKKNNQYEGFPIQFKEQEFNSYEHFFNYMVHQLRLKLDGKREHLDQFNYAADKLKGYVGKNQATFNMLNLTEDPPELFTHHTGEVFSIQGMEYGIEQFFTSGLLTRMGRERAMFTSPRVVSAIWSVRPTENVKAEARTHFTQQIEKAYEGLTGDAQKTVASAMSNYGVKKPYFLEEVRMGLLRQFKFPTYAATMYYEPPEGMIEGYLLYEAHKIKTGRSSLIRGH